MAAALESRLDSQSFSAMQAALLMNKLKAGAAMAAAETSTASGLVASAEKKKASKASMGDKLNKNTVASLLAKSRQQQLTSDELEQAEKAWSRPELTIEPLFRGQNQRYNRHTCCIILGKKFHMYLCTYYLHIYYSTKILQVVETPFLYAVHPCTVAKNSCFSFGLIEMFVHIHAVSVIVRPYVAFATQPIFSKY